MNSTIIRCPWGNSDNLKMQNYHDQVWGKPTHQDTELFEYLTLEIFQAGLSWETVINKQAAFLDAFANFNLEEVAAFSAKELEALKNNPAIIRNKLKITATINNAQVILALTKKFGSFDNYLSTYWPEQIINHWQKEQEIPATTTAAENLTKQMKHDGFKFIGPTIIYSFLQATGRINDHLKICTFKY